MNPDVLAAYNPWWSDGRLQRRYADTVPRDVLPSAVHLIDPARVLQVLGIRRCGKSVLLHQMIGSLISSGVDPRDIVYLSADDPLLGDPATLLPEALGFHRDRVRRSSAGTVHVFVDEVHAIPRWPLLLKRYIDLVEPFTWVVSSSAGVLLQPGSTESLVGRAWALRLYPFSLAEYAACVGSPLTPLLRNATAMWADADLSAPRERAGLLDDLDREALGSREALTSLSRAYLRDGGFPEALSLEGADRARYFADAVIGRLVLLDVPAIAEIRNPAMMAALVRRLVAAGAGLINVSEMARDLETTKVTLSDYLSVIDTAMVDFILDRYAANVAGRQRGMKKSVPLDSGMTASIGRWDLDGIDASRNEGLLAESVVHAWLRRHDTGIEVTHWREEDREVDFVASSVRNVLPIEVKWRDGARTRKLSGLDAFRRRFACNEALIVTRDTFEVRENEMRLPLWMLG